MLVKKEHMAAKLLAIHLVPDRPGCGAPDVYELGGRREDDSPAGPLDSVGEVDLFAEHEVALVEARDRVEDIPPHEHDGTHQELCITLAIVPETGTVERVEDSTARCELPQEEVLGADPPDRWKPPNRPLRGAVRIGETRSHDSDRRHEPR